MKRHSFFDTDRQSRMDKRYRDAIIALGDLMFEDFKDECVITLDHEPDRDDFIDWMYNDNWLRDISEDVNTVLRDNWQSRYAQ